MKKVVIIGAGPAGITAAYELSKEKDYDIVLLEESGAMGGISRTVNHEGNRMDIGGHRFFSKSREVTAWWYEILSPQGAPARDEILLHTERAYAKGGKDPEKEDDVMLERQRISRIYYKNHFFDYPVSLSKDTIRNMGFQTTLRAGFSYLYACIRKLPETSLENFYINRFGKVLYSMFFEGYTEKLWGRHPSEISADWGAQRVKGLSIAGIIRNIFGKIFGETKEVETSLIESFYYPKFGPGELWETAARRAYERGVRILAHSKAVEIKTEGNKVCGVVYEVGGRREFLPADVVISSMPIKDLLRALPDTPSDVRTIGDGLPYRDFITVGVLADRLKLQNTTNKKTVGNIVPDCWIYVQDTSVKLGRIQIFNNWSPYMVRDFENTVWIGLEYFCTEGDAMWNMPEADFADMAVTELEKIGVISRADVKDTHVEKVKKAYPAYFDTYRDMDRAVEYLNKYENLYCVGRNGQHRYNNMDHSMMTAFLTVREIQNPTGNKKAIWEVNTEQEYHEENK